MGITHHLSAAEVYILNCCLGCKFCDNQSTPSQISYELHVDSRSSTAAEFWRVFATWRGFQRGPAVHILFDQSISNENILWIIEKDMCKNIKITGVSSSIWLILWIIEKDMRKNIKITGVSSTIWLSTVQDNFILGGSKVTQSVIRECVLCRKLRRPIEEQFTFWLSGEYSSL